MTNTVATKNVLGVSIPGRVGGNLAFVGEHCQDPFSHRVKNVVWSTIRATCGDSAEARDRIFFRHQGCAEEIREEMPQPWQTRAIRGRSSCTQSLRLDTAGRCVSACNPPAPRPRSSSRCRRFRSWPRRTSDSRFTGCVLSTSDQCLNGEGGIVHPSSTDQASSTILLAPPAAKDTDGRTRSLPTDAHGGEGV